MVGQLFSYEVAIDAEAGHLGKRKHRASISSCQAEDFSHAVHWSVEGSCS